MHLYSYKDFLPFTKAFIVLVFFCALSMMPARAQTDKTDSLRTLLSKYKNNKDTLYLKSLSQLTYQLFLFQSTDATYYAKKLVAESKKVGYLQGQADGLKIQGLIHRVRGAHKMALEHLEKSLALYQRLNNQKEIGHVLNEIGLVCNHQGYYSKALQYYYKSLKISEKINNLPIIAANYNNIAGIQISIGNVDKALFFFKKSLEINIKANNKEGIARSYHNIGGIYTEQKKYEEALDSFYKTLAIEKEIGSRLISFETLNNIGSVHYYKGEYDKALEFFEESNRIALEMKHPVIQIYNHTGIANVYFAQKNYTESIIQAKNGLAIAQQMKVLTEISTLSKILYKNHKAQQNYQKALEYHELYGQNNDSLFNIEKTRVINSLEAKADIERKEKEISILNKDKKLLKTEKDFQEKIIYLIILSLLIMSTLTYFIYQSRRQERKANHIISTQNIQLKNQTEEIQKQAIKLTQMNADKDRLFAIIGHDLRSPINSLTGLLSLLEDKQISPEEFILFSSKLKTSVEHVHFTLNNLLLWANNQMNGIQTSPSKIHLHEIAQENIKFLNTLAEAKKIELINEIPASITVFADIDQVKLIFRNLISNAIKFTLLKGKIRLQASQQENLVQVNIKDNGVGMSAQIKANLFGNLGISVPGTHKEKGTGLGLILCKDFVEKNGGQLWVESQEDVGSTFYFTLPKA